jgi:ABC-type multidrug transport system ATPase subunit
MKVQLIDVAKRFNKEWIFKGVNLTLESNKIYGLTGANGSGKTTLISIISHFVAPTEGEVKYELGTKLDLRQAISLASPAISLLEEMTVLEAIEFHAHYKPFRNNLSSNGVIQLLGFEKHQYKLLRELSTGMKQRVKLVLAILSQSEVLLLDEPGSNLDAAGFEFWKELLKNNSSDRIVVIASNDEQDLAICDHRLDMKLWK